MAANTFIDVAENQVKLFDRNDGTYQIQNKSFDDLHITEITDIGQVHQDTELAFLTLNMIGGSFVVAPFGHACVTKETGSQIYMWYGESQKGLVSIAETE